MMFKKILIFTVLLSLFSCNEKLSNKEKLEYISKGKEITQSTFKELSSNLIAQMKLGGPMQAIPFCNTEAIPITKKKEQKFNVSIKRTSEKLRNTENKATERELQIINNYRNALKNNRELTPVVEKNINKNIQFYAPIIIDAKCLACHGKFGEELNVKTDSLVKKLYPKDLAIGYKAGDIRGIWSIEFKK